MVDNNGKREVLFSVDMEDYNHALHIVKKGYTAQESALWLLKQLSLYKIKAVVYVLGRFAEEFPDVVREFIKEGHIIGDHGHYHDYGEAQEYPFINKFYRSPYWATEKMPYPPSGGFFFRFMPYWYVKAAAEDSGVFWIHPHDIMENHPKLKNPWLNWKRHIGLKGARKKLERLMKELKWKSM